MSLGGVCLVFTLAGCQAMLRPLSVFRRHCKCETVAGTAAGCTTCASPSTGLPLEYAGDIEGLPHPEMSAYSDPIVLPTSPIMLDGQPLPEGVLPPGALPEGFIQSAPLPGPGVVVPAPAPAPGIPAEAPPAGSWVPAPSAPTPPPQVLQPAPSQKPVSPPQEQASLTLPPPTYHVQAPVVHPSPPPRRARVSPPATTPEPVQEPVQQPVVEAPPKTIQTPKPPVPTQPEAKPGALTMNVSCSPSVAKLGEEVRFEISIRNQGETAIEQVEISAVLSDNLQGKVIQPEGTGRFDGQKVVFEPIKPLTPMELKYTLSAVVTKLDGGNGKLTVEAKSPILMSGPLKNEASVTIGDEEASKQD